MIIDRLIPTRPHSTVSGLVNTYNDIDALIVRMYEFTPNVAVRTARDLLLYEAMVLVGEHQIYKKIEDAEITAAKAYFGDLWTYLQDQQARHNINSIAPRRLTNWADGEGHNIWSIDELETEMQNVSVSNIATIPGIENLVKEMNPVWTLAYDDEVQSLPASKFLAWAPSLKVTESDTLRKALANNTDLFENFCAKLGLKLPKLNMDTFLAKPVPQIKPMDFTDYRWLFWAFSALWTTSTEDDGTAAELQPTISGNAQENIDAEGDETWLTDGAFGYIVPNGGTPCALNAIIRFFYRYYANDNPLGAVVTPNADTLDLDIVGNDKTFLGQIAINDVSGGDAHKTFAMVDQTLQNKICQAAFGAFLDDETYACEKVVDGDANKNVLTQNQLLGGHRYLPYIASAWSANYNLERSFFTQVLRGVRSGGSTGKGRKLNTYKGGKRGNKRGKSGSSDKGDSGERDIEGIDK